MANYTPGPWRYHNDAIQSEAPETVSPKEYETGVRLIVLKINPHTVTPANARLLAAAPDLLEALQALLKADLYAEGEGLCAIELSDTQKGESAVNQAKAAINKALKGE